MYGNTRISAPEELGHFEMIATIVHQLTRNMSMEELKASGFEDYYGIIPRRSGPRRLTPFTAAMFQSVGDPITDLTEDMAAEEKPAPPTTTSYTALRGFPDVTMPSGSCGPERLYISNVSEKPSRIVQDK